MARAGFVLTADGQTIDNPEQTQRSEMVHSLFGEERNNWWTRSNNTRGDVDHAAVDWRFGTPPLGSTPMPDKTTTTQVDKGLVMVKGKDGKVTQAVWVDHHDGWRPMVLQPVVMGGSPGISATVERVQHRSVKVVGP